MNNNSEMMLSCLIVTTTYTDVFSIQVEQNDTINVLKTKIKEQDYYELDSNCKYTMWKVNLPQKDIRKKLGLLRSYTPFNLSIKGSLGGTELINPLTKLEEIFSEGVAGKNIHIALLIQPEPNNYVHVFVDDSNLFIEGKFAVGQLEQLGSQNIKRGIELKEYRIDHGMLLSLVLDKRPQGNKPVLVGSHPPKDEVLWNFIKQKNYEVKTLATRI